MFSLIPLIFSCRNGISHKKLDESNSKRAASRCHLGQSRKNPEKRGDLQKPRKRSSPAPGALQTAILEYDSVRQNPRSLSVSCFFHKLKKDLFRAPKSRYAYDEHKNLLVELEENPIIGIQTPEGDQGLWGGERVVKGWIESAPYTKKKILPRYWVPKLFFPALKSVVLYSEILDKYIKVWRFH